MKLGKIIRKAVMKKHPINENLKNMSKKRRVRNLFTFKLLFLITITLDKKRLNLKC